MSHRIEILALALCVLLGGCYDQSGSVDVVIATGSIAQASYTNVQNEKDGIGYVAFDKNGSHYYYRGNFTVITHQ